MKSRGGIWYLKGLSSCFIRRGWALRFNECRLKVGLCWSAATGDTCASLSAAANQSGLEGMKGDWAVAALILCVCVRCQELNTHTISLCWMVFWVLISPRLPRYKQTMQFSQHGVFLLVASWLCQHPNSRSLLLLLRTPIGSVIFQLAGQRWIRLKIFKVADLLSQKIYYFFFHADRNCLWTFNQLFFHCRYEIFLCTFWLNCQELVFWY